MSQFLINTDWFCSFRSFKLYQRKKRKGDCCGNNPKLSENKMCVFWVDPPTFSHLHILFMLKMTIDYIKINCMTTILYMSSTTLVLLCWYHVSIPVAVPTMKSKVCFSLWYLIQYDTTETTGICISITGAHIHAMPQTLHSCTHTALNSVWLRPTPTPLPCNLLTEWTTAATDHSFKNSRSNVDFYYLWAARGIVTIHQVKLNSM